MTRQNDTPLSASQADRKASSACEAEGAFPYEDIVNTPWPPVSAGGAVSAGAASTAGAPVPAGGAFTASAASTASAPVSASAASTATGVLSANGDFREHMPLDDRAKIFAPFAALKGFAEACRSVEEKLSENAAPSAK